MTDPFGDLRASCKKPSLGGSSVRELSVSEGGHCHASRDRAAQNPGRRLKENVHPPVASKRRTASSSKIMPATLIRAPVPTLRSSEVAPRSGIQNRPKSEKAR